MIDRHMPRIQEVTLPILRGAFPDMQVVSWVPAVDMRTYPLIEVRRLGGLPEVLDELDEPVIELTAYGDDSLADTENLLLDAQWVLKNAVNQQTVTPAGYLHSFFMTMGPTAFESPYADTWRVQSLIQLGLRPPRK